METLWANPKMKALAAEFDEYRATIEFGDPLVVARKYGKGRVCAVSDHAPVRPRAGTIGATAWRRGATRRS